MSNNAQFQSVTYEDWLKAAEAQLKGKPIENIFSKTYEGLVIKPLYDANDSQANLALRDFSNRKKGWNIAQLVIGDTPEELNRQLLQAIKRGQNSLHFSVDEVTHVDQLEVIFHNIDVTMCTFFIDATTNRAFLPLLMRYCERKGIAPSSIKGSIAIDPFYEMIEYGKDDSTFEEAVSFIESSITWARESQLHIQLILVRGAEFHEAGAHAIQELTYAFLQSIELLEALTDKGFSIDELVPYFQFSFSVSSDFFMEIAKLRAAKTIWNSIAAAYGAKEENRNIHLHAQTSNWNKSQLDTHVNLLRTTNEAFAAVIGGGDYLTIVPFDNVMHTSELGERIARNIHFILQEESFLHKVQDPAGGAYFVESLTEQVTEKVWENIQRYEKEGGFIAQFLKGTIQDEIDKTYEEKVSDLKNRQQLLIGTNIYANIDDHLLDEKRERRDTWITVSTIEECYSAMNANSGSVHSLRKSFEKQEQKTRPVIKKRWAEPFEHLRKRAQSYKNQNGSFPQVAVVTVGKLKDYKPRLDFVKGVMATGGVVVNEYELHDTITEQVIILCGASDDYKELSIGEIKRLKQNGWLWVVGKESEGDRDWPVDQFVYSGVNVLQLLEEMHQLLGVENE